MRWGIESVKDFAALVSSFAIIVGIVGYALSRKQFQFNVMIKCIERFQTLLPSLESLPAPESLEDQDIANRNRIIRQYIDLCEEELFYFMKGYLPGDLKYEWIEGMLTYLPFYNEKGELMNKSNRLQLAKDSPLLRGYPRLRQAFGLSPEESHPEEKLAQELAYMVYRRLDDTTF